MHVKFLERERERTDLGDFKRSDPHDHNTDNKKQPSPVFQTHIYETKNHSLCLFVLYVPCSSSSKANNHTLGSLFYERREKT
jgi:hypothetical protein